MSSALSECDVAALAGPKLLGCCFNWALLGVLTVQTYLYHVNFPHDPVILQCLVYGLFTFETVQTGLATSDCFDTFVFHYGDYAALVTFSGHAGWFFVCFMCSVVSFVEQAFFAWRIHVLARKTWLVTVILIIALAQASAGIVLGFLLRGATSPADIPSSLDVVITATLIIWVAGSALVDVLIAVTMTVLMLKLRHRTRAYQSQSANEVDAERTINRVIRIVVETGSLTAGIAVVTLILCMRWSEKQYYMATIYIITKLYANTFVANLVSRAFLSPRDSSSLEPEPKPKIGPSSDASGVTDMAARATTVALSTCVPMGTSVQMETQTEPELGSGSGVHSNVSETKRE